MNLVSDICWRRSIIFTSKGRDKWKSSSFWFCTIWSFYLCGVLRCESKRCGRWLCH